MAPSRQDALAINHLYPARCQQGESILATKKCSSWMCRFSPLLGHGRNNFKLYMLPLVGATNGKHES
eukprot:1516242-Amphidinium_carterae.1